MAEARSPTLAIFSDAHAADAITSFANPIASGAPLVLLVRDATPVGSRLEVFLPIRPNGSTGWIERADVELRTTEYRLRIDLSEHRLTVEYSDQILIETPVGLGRAATPTPGGVYFVVELLQAPDPTGPYGPYAYGLSGYSEQLKDFAGGTGVVGIHGTNEPATLGMDVSHGCIRVSNEVITRLASVIPLGTPVVISP